MAPYVFLNGTFLPVADAHVSVYDGGYLHGAGLFETLAAHHGCVFRLDAHLERMIRSAEKLGLPIERPDLPLTRDFVTLVERNELTSARLRLTVTVGTLHATTADEERPSLNVCATAAPLPPYPPELLARGMTVLITPFRQSTADPLAGHKTTNYLPRLLALRQARKFECGEALWFSTENLLAEGCISNVFVVRHNRLATPPIHTPVLPGVSRAVVIELANAHGIPVEETHLTIEDLLDADEVFLTNSSMQVMPVCRVEKSDIGKGLPGPLTRRIRDLFVDCVTTECATPES